ncbi:MAG: DNA internalization-related competence protein ComEC/Rec2 [Woeseiaceae bacterium]
MVLFCLCALAGAYTLQLCSHLPDRVLVIALIPVSLAACLPTRTRFVGAYLAGFALLAYCAHTVIDDRLSPELVGQTLVVDARILDFPKASGASLSFLAEPLGREDLPARIRLSWFDAAIRPSLGETWQLEVRLRRPRGFSNPGGFDYEAWLFRKAIGATGYVVNGSNTIRRDHEPVDRVSRLRRRFVVRVGAGLPDDDAAAVVMAVAVGARHAITREQWNRYAGTGTSHLMAISGLHIGLAAGGVFFLCWFLLSLSCRRINIRDCAAVVAAIAAFAYAEISGFAVPARRALLMAVILVAAGLVRRQLPASRLLAMCGVAILFSDPLAILAPGFKLSFAAVAILFWHLRVTRVPVHALESPLAGTLVNGIRRLSSTQLALLFGLFPLTALLFDRVAILAPLVNLLAIPIFNFLTVPACLLGLMLDGPLQGAGDFALHIAHASVVLVLWLVRQAAGIPLANFQIARLEGLVVIVALLPSLMCLAPPGFPGRRLALVAAVATILYRPPAPPAGCLDMHVLDVGQGLGVVLRTERHAAVFDTGPSFRSGSDIGQLVLAPFLQSAGIKKLDLLVVSHADQDHAGGARSLTRQISIKKMLSGELLDDVDLRQGRCRAGDSWQWDGIEFVIIHPADTDRWHGNNASCVLELRIGRRRVVVTGDIESPVENLLLRRGLLRAADIVLIPHHGSRTSSSAAFIKTVRPRVAIVSAGFDNRWGFPKEDIVRRWRHSGAEVLNTASSGAISYRLCRGEGFVRRAEHRLDERRYWHDLARK